MREDEKQLEDIITSNSFQKQALDTIAENEYLKAKLNKAINLLSNLNNHPIPPEYVDNELSELADLFLSSTPEQCVESIRLQAIRELARTECPVSGYVITSPKSRLEMLEWANFQERCANEDS